MTDIAHNFKPSEAIEIFGGPFDGRKGAVEILMPEVNGRLAPAFARFEGVWHKLDKVNRRWVHWPQGPSGGGK